MSTPFPLTRSTLPEPSGYGRSVKKPRYASWSSSTACGTVRIRAAGTPTAVSACSHSTAVRWLSAALSSSLSAARLRFLASRSANRGSVASCGLPTSRHSFSNCSCWLAAMFSGPSAASKVPDGAAVAF